MIEILDYTKNPLQAIGEYAGYCYDSDVTDQIKNINRAKHCLSNNHGRNLEFATITLKITCSARVAREFYTHIGGAPTRVQASTRYITYDNFNYFIPSFDNDLATEEYVDCMYTIEQAYNRLKELEIDNDKAGYILPLSMMTTFIWKGNARTLENMFGQRLCTRALAEYRELMHELKYKINTELDEEWKWISNNMFKVKCAKAGKCLENNPKCQYNNFK